MNIVFLVGSYYPYFSAVGTCCYNIANVMSEENNVKVICLKSTTDQPKYGKIGGHEIIRVSYPWRNKRLGLNEKINSYSGFHKKLYQGLLVLLKIKEYFQVLFSKTSLNQPFIDVYTTALTEITEPVDVIIPFSFPMEAVLAGMEFKKRNENTILIPYLFDPFVESQTMHRTNWNRAIKRNRHRLIEKEMLELSSKVYCVNHLYDSLSQYAKDNKNNKITATEHPLFLEKMQSNKIDFKNKQPIFIYTGTFHKRIRKPDYLLKLMKNVNKKLKIELHMYTSGNCGSIIKKYSSELKGHFFDYGYVSKEKANTAILNSQILVSVGNIGHSQSPSKIFEYISTGKPIIHLYNDERDVNLEILKNYPLSLCLHQDNEKIEENTSKVISFFMDNKNRVLDFVDLESRFSHASPLKVAREITRSICMEINNK